MTPPGSHGPELRIADRDREAAVTALGEHYAAGRLTKEEFDERADAAWAARTASGLWPLFADLPRPAVQQPAPATVHRTPAAVPAQRRPPLPPLVIALLLLLLVASHGFVLVLLLVWAVLSRFGRPGPYGGHGTYGAPPTARLR